VKDSTESLVHDIRQYSQGLVVALEENRYNDVLYYVTKMQNRLQDVAEYSKIKKKLGSAEDSAT